MNDPLSEVIDLLQPRAVFSRRINGAGRWGVRYSALGQPSFCAVLEGSCRLTVDGHRPLTLDAGDFVLLPARRVSRCRASMRCDSSRRDPT
jgi:Cupin